MSGAGAVRAREPGAVFICRGCRKKEDEALYLELPAPRPNCERCSAVADLAVQRLETVGDAIALLVRALLRSRR